MVGINTTVFVTVLVSDNINIDSDKDSIYLENNRITKICVPKKRNPKYMGQRMTELKGEIGISTINNWRVSIHSQLLLKQLERKSGI